MCNGLDLPHVPRLTVTQLDDVADLARITRTSRLFYYMTLPRLYEECTLRTYSEIRYVNGRPAGYGSGSPFAMGLNTLVSRNFGDYVQTFRVIGEWREHDVDDYSKGRVPDNSMMLQVAMRAALDKMKILKTFAWELNTKPLQTVYEGLMQKPQLTSLTLRFPSRRIPRPTTVVPPLPNLKSLICYDIDPLSSPDNISLLLLTSKNLESLTLHFNPRMRETGEESINLLNYFGRCIAAKHTIPLKRMAMWNLYARNQGEGIESTFDPKRIEEVTIIQSMGSADPMTVFIDNTWRLNPNRQIPENLKTFRCDNIDAELADMLSKFRGLERLYLIHRPVSSRPSSTTQTPTSSSTPANSSAANGAVQCGTQALPSEQQCKSLAGDYLAVIQANHRTMRHLLLSDHWILSDDALFKVFQTCPHLEQVGFACGIPAFESLRHILSLTPNLWALRLLVPQGSELQVKLDSIDIELHKFAMAAEMWRPEYNKIKYVGVGDMAFRLGEVIWPKRGPGMPPGTSAGTEPEGGMNALKMMPMRSMEIVDRNSLNWIEIWGMDTADFDPKFPWGVR